MSYKVFYKASVEKDLRKLVKSDQVKISTTIESKLADNPKELGKTLKGKLKGLWSYRVSNYRVIFKLAETESHLLVLRISHRKEVYK